MKRALAWLLLAVSASCASQRQAHITLSAERLARAQTLDARSKAPSAWRAFEQARERAQSARPDSEAQRDDQSEARLWLETAIAQAEQERLSEQRLRLETEIHTLMAEALAHQRARQAIATERNRREAARLALEEAEKALARAATHPKRRPALSTEQTRKAAHALLARASLVQTAAAALSPPTPAVDALAADIDAARELADRAPERALGLADEALFSGLALLGPLRAAREGGPSDEERAALAEALALSGANTTRGDVGLSAVVARAFVAGSLVPEARRILSRLCTLAQAHPHGPVRLLARFNPQTLDLRGLATTLESAGCAGDRFSLQAAVDPGPDLTMTWLSY